MITNTTNPAPRAIQIQLCKSPDCGITVRVPGLVRYRTSFVGANGSGVLTSDFLPDDERDLYCSTCAARKLWPGAFAAPALRCECGSGNHARSAGHSDWCALYTTQEEP